MTTPTTYQLRPYQTQAVEAALSHFRKHQSAAVIVLPTGAGKSLVIAKLAALARGRVLVLAHVKELVEQNHQKYTSYGHDATVFSAGLQQKNASGKVVFASVQSVSANLECFDAQFSLLVIDECHRVSNRTDSQYNKVLDQLHARNSALRVLGLTATPYRLGMGWVYRYHYRGFVRSDQAKPFEHCIYELPLAYLIRAGFLTKPTVLDMPIAQYDFSGLKSDAFGRLPSPAVNQLLVKHKRVTQSIVQQITELAQQREGVMIFAATVEHAKEIMGYLPEDESALIIGDTPGKERDTLIERFKAKAYKYLVNVSVLTTGFDAPHVDFIALLRATQSVSLFQQIVGRGLRLAEGKSDCLIADYAGNGFNLFHPEVGEKKPNSRCVPVQVLCPECEFPNIFWGITDSDGDLIEHFGRRCQGLVEDNDKPATQCNHRYRFKECPRCFAQNDIAARTCHQCQHRLIDPDDQLRAALQLKNALVLRCAGMVLTQTEERLRVDYHDEDGMHVSEWFNFTNQGQVNVFNQTFGSRHAQGLDPREFKTIVEVLACSLTLTAPDFVVARKVGRFWRIQEKIFDYQGIYRKANQLTYTQ